MESLTEEINNSENELIQLIKYHVEHKLFEYHILYGVHISYELRDICVFDIKKILEKKYFNDTNFHDKKEKLVKILVDTVITNDYLEDK
jgi:hypothetical protein